VRRSAVILSLVFLVSAHAAPVAAQTQIKGRALVTVDTSGSMVWHFGDCNTTGGDGAPGAALFCDNGMGQMLNGQPVTSGGVTYACSPQVACTLANGAASLFPIPSGTTLSNPSRMYAAKAALNDVINAASGAIDFGLEKYANYSLNDGSTNFCPNATYCCTPPTDGTTRGRCIPQILDNYPDVANSVNCVGTLKSDCNLTSLSGCGTSIGCAGGTAACGTTDGGTILVQPGAGSSASVQPWVDFVEDFCSNGSGAPRNPELRAGGATPLAGSIRTARHGWYQPIFNVSKQTLPGGGANPSYNPSSPLFDAKIDCRSYVNVVMTDGVESCENAGALFTDPTTAVTELTALNPTNPVKTYVIGMAFVANESCNPSPADHSKCPQTGGCKTVNGQSVCGCANNNDCGSTCEIDNALGTYVHYVCGTDGVCHHPGLAALNAMAAAGGTGSARFANSQTDIEAAFADIVASTVKVEKCNQKDDDCDGICDEPYPDVAEPAGCAPPGTPGFNSDGSRNAKTCDNGQLAGTHCFASGAFVCSQDQLSEVCNAPTCATNTALCPTKEVCDGKDDDCNGVIDDCTPFVAGSCCTLCPACNKTGKPQPETCNGCDDDCDGIADNHLTDTGLSCGSSVGMCEPGSTYCCQQSNPTTGTCTTDPVTVSSTHVNSDSLFCLGGRGPATEICNGVDDNCNGVTDEISQSCYDGPTGTSGVGICHGGTQQCTATGCGVAPNACCPSLSPPIVNGKMCPSLASACPNPPGTGSCFGACSGEVTPKTEVCNGIDDNCNGQTDEAPLGDPWVGQPCCPTGNLADCSNSGGSTRCKPGAFQCVNGGQACVGAVAKAVEVCNGIDDDCNGIIDDVAGAGQPCTGGGTNTTGICTAAWACKAGVVGPGPGGLTCTQVQGPKPEVCNGLDDNCNGLTDEASALTCATGTCQSNGICSGSTQTCDPRLNVACGQNCPGGLTANCVGACKAGTSACSAGVVVCNGSTGPTNEVCNAIDDNCNGITDDVAGIGQACNSGGVNTTGVCTASLVCNAANPGTLPGGLTCTQNVGPTPEICNGLDDDCDGVTDEDILCPTGQTCVANVGDPTHGMCSGGTQTCDPSVGGGCGQNCPGGLTANCVGACKPGVVACINGAKVCQGSTGPTPEVCNGIDDNCNGIIDDNLTDTWLGTTCCPTGNLADCGNTGGSTRCHTGTWQCTPGMSASDLRTCVGGVAQSPEVCNNIDDNCNGVTDDVPGLGAACTSPSVRTLGPCTAAYTCNNGTPGPGPSGLTCTQIVGPKPEICNGVDDDCDGAVDEPGAVAANDMRIGVVGGMPCTPLTPLPGTMFPASGPAQPCNPGVTACKAGMVVCQGEVGPTPNQCNGISTDCTGIPNTNGNCPSGLLCSMGNCLVTCTGGEFPCAGGFVCDRTLNPPNGICVPDKCAMKNCPPGDLCKIDSTGTANCIDPCANVTCNSGFTCKLGVCLDCTSVGCPSGKKCAGAPPMCVTDPCFGVTCPQGQFCDNAGHCVNPCATCMKGEICQNGQCVMDPCSGVQCPSGQVCSSMTGHCIENQCAFGCNPGTLCCQGMCINDPCAGFSCPGGTVCKIDGGCSPYCSNSGTDQVAATGGGGASCSMSGASANPSSGAIVALLALVAALLLRRRALLLALLAGIGLAASGCHTDPFCLNCGQQDGTPAPEDLTAPPDFTPPPDLIQADLVVPPDLTVTGCMITNGGVEICDHLDNDCNGITDDVAPAKLAADPNNCGACFNVCDYTAIHEAGACNMVNGKPTCQPAGCLPGYIDLDKNPANGCEYACTPTVPPTEICDGKDNDCNGGTDEPFGFPNYATDPNNCGGCGNVCNLPGAVAKCVPTPGTDGGAGVGECVVDHCINNGTDTFKVTNFMPGTLNTTGCDHHCPKPSTTVTTGSQDCNTVMCSFPAEVCNGIDDDCDFIVDDHLTDTGGACGAMNVGICMAGKVTCVAGVLQCQGAVKPTLETCNGKDDDCNGITDDNLTDPWLGQACCPTGNLADCTNTGTGTRCMSGAFQCVTGAKTCQGGIAKSSEVCNGIDDNCDGLVDNVPGVGTACTSSSVNTQGVCTASWSCNGGVAGPGPSGLTCMQVIGPRAAGELCNGLDDNCNGLTDENITNASDNRIGVTCATLCPGGLLANCVGQCKAGATVCTSGAVTCAGGKGPSPEVCDGIDNDCNGITDDVPGIGQACTGNGVLTAGPCTAAYTCNGTPGTGPNGLTCTQKVGPKPEICNGIDDDCDGMTDEPAAVAANDPRVGVACGQNCPGGTVTGCKGACLAGKMTCSAGVVVCQGSTGPNPETCNGIDDDCNGLVDDPFTAAAPGGYADGNAGQKPLYNSSSTTCGSCTNACALQHAVNKCVSDAAIDPSGKGVCEVLQCNAGFNYVPSTPCGTSPAENGPSGVGCNYTCPVYPPTPEVCDGKDNDCNGATDEAKSACYTNGLVPPAGLCSNVGVCAGQNVTATCTGAGGWDCRYCGVANADVDASCHLLTLEKECDCLDNNCNGVTDKDGFPTLGQSCSAGQGVCQVKGSVMCASATKTAQCMTGSGGGCFGGTVAAPNFAAASNELCDNKDNDCNGLTDESTPFTVTINGTPTTFQGWHDPMVAVPKPGGGTVFVYAFEASRPDATGATAGTVTTRACANTGTLPWADVTEPQAAAACAAVRDGKGNPLRLCSSAEWQAACEGPAGTGNSKWSFSVNPISYVKQICNNLDESATPAVWATGSNGAQSVALNEFCFTDWTTAGKIHDLSGNLSEWTSTTINVGSNTYYQLRGGAFDSPSGGTTCEFSFDIAQATFANSDVGFRCCADNAACGDTTSDPANCGSCGNACTGGTPVCLSGACAATCGALTNCSNACVDTNTNVFNCGGCNKPCPAGQTCSGGACGCPSGSTLCNGACVNTQTDPTNCGTCNNVCTGVCSNGTCAASCGSGLTACGGSCVNLQNSNANCGSCGNACPIGTQCVTGACCSQTVCGGACVNTLTDVNNCGGCSKPCGAGQSCQNGLCCGTGLTNCGGTCVNLSNDRNNCNACGNVCPGTNTCTNGSCCGAGLLTCGAQCVNPLTDSQNCGSCFNVCPSGTTCQNGGCCPPGKTTCNGVCVDTTSDNNNCGTCGTVCGGGALCKNSSCSCGTYSSYCGGTCIFTANDFNNCGGCGNVCAAGQVCSNGLCTGSCSQGSSCGGSCFDTANDPFKCGGGCVACTGGNSCVGGSCGMGIIPFVPNPGGICTSNGGLGPVIQLSTSLPPRGTGGGTTCSGDIAATSFGFGICACASFHGGGNSTIDAWNSAIGPYMVGPNAGNGALGGSLAVNTTANITSGLVISGDLDAFGDLTCKATVSEQIHIGGSDTTSSLSSGGLAEIRLPTGSGTFSTNTAFAPNLGMFVAPNPPNPNTTCSGYTIANGGCNIENPFNGPASQEPCKRCDKAQQIPIAAYVANYAVNNDDAAIGLTAAVRNTIATGASGVLTLPCGYYYLDSIKAAGTFTIVATGNTALFVGGNIDGSGGSIIIDETPGARFDIFVLGNVSMFSAPTLGDLLYPANQRMYIACSSSTAAGSCAQNSDCCSGTCTAGACSAATDAFFVHNPSLFAGDFYLPNGPLTTMANTNMYGSIFAHDYLQSSGNFNLHYDKASASSNSVCPPPAGKGCSSCLDCSNQACVGAPSGTCGSCTSDSQCCAPLRCVGGTCQFTSF